MSSPSLEVEVYVKLIRTAEALHAAVSSGLIAEKTTASQFSAMKALRYHGPMPQKQVAAYLLKTAGNVTLVLDNLEKQGMINRVRQTDDRRVINVSLTDLGRETFDRMYPHHLQRINSAMSPLVAEQLTELSDLLQRLHTTVNQPKCGPEQAQEVDINEAI